MSEPIIINHVIGAKRISQMTADEYLAAVRKMESATAEQGRPDKRPVK
jgi:hypothetical protein